MAEAPSDWFRISPTSKLSVVPKTLSGRGRRTEKEKNPKSKQFFAQFSVQDDTDSGSRIITGLVQTSVREDSFLWHMDVGISRATQQLFCATILALVFFFFFQHNTRAMRGYAARPHRN